MWANFIFITLCLLPYPSGHRSICWCSLVNIKADYTVLLLDAFIWVLWHYHCHQRHEGPASESVLPLYRNSMIRPDTVGDSRTQPCTLSPSDPMDCPGWCPTRLNVISLTTSVLPKPMKMFTFNLIFPHGDIRLFDPLCKAFSSSDFDVCGILLLLSPFQPRPHPVSHFILSTQHAACPEGADQGHLLVQTLFFTYPQLFTHTHSFSHDHKTTVHKFVAML